jgi:hypothetical protein
MRPAVLLGHLDEDGGGGVALGVVEQIAETLKFGSGPPPADLLSQQPTGQPGSWSLEHAHDEQTADESGHG